MDANHRMEEKVGVEIRAERRLKLTSCHCMPKRWTTEEEAVKAESEGDRVAGAASKPKRTFSS